MMKGENVLARLTSGDAMRHALLLIALTVAFLGLLPLSPSLAQGLKLRDTLKGHTGIVTCMTYSPDGKTLASSSQDHTIKLWDVGTGKERATLKGHIEEVSSVAFSPNGRTLASGGKDITLWDVATGKERATLKGHKGDVISVAYSPDGMTLASGSVDDKTINLWGVKKAEEPDN